MDGRRFGHQGKSKIEVIEHHQWVRFKAYIFDPILNVNDIFAHSAGDLSIQAKILPKNLCFLDNSADFHLIFIFNPASLRGDLSSRQMMNPSMQPKGFAHIWRAQKYDGAIGVITFGCTLGFAPHLDKGIIIGVILSLGHFLFRNIRPEIATLSKWVDGTYRNAERRGLKTCKHIAVIRFNNSLFFATVNYLEEKILEPITQMPYLRHIHVVGNGINALDASGVEALAKIVERVREAGYGFSISGLNDTVINTMKRTNLYRTIGEDHIFGNVNLALQSIWDRTHQNAKEECCPLMECVKLDGSSPNPKGESTKENY